MSEWKVYANSPLKEALLDIRVRLPEGVTAESLASVQEGEEERYSTREVQTKFYAEFRGGPQEGVAASTRQHHGGFRFRSEDGQRHFQVQADGFAFNWLAPYSRWTTFRDEARRLWARYCEVARPLAISRIALRYINQIPIPADVDFGEFLRTVPQVAPDLPQGLSSFLMHLEIPQPDIPRCMLLINEHLVPAPDPDAGSIILDLDLFRLVDMPVDDTVLWEAFEQLRDRKNQAFEACITDRTRKVIR